MLWSRPPPSMRKPTDLKDKGDLMLMGSVGQELHHLEKERAIQTDPEETRRRRTIQLVRQDPVSGSWGFTLQTYGIRNKRSQEVEVMTYVDYVELHGPAYIAGMRRGDVLLSVNGESVEGLNHPKLVAQIQKSKEKLRLVVLFEDCCRKVELYERFIKLKRLLSQKMRELKQLEYDEKLLCSGGRLSRLGTFRDSVRSSTSSDWDCYSEIASPGVLDAVAPNQKAWRQHFFTRSIETLDTTSELSFDYPSPFGSSRESLGGVSQDSLTQKDSSADSTGEKTSEVASCAEQSNGACSLDPGDSTPITTTSKFYIEDDSSDSEVPTLRRPRKDTPAEPYPGCRTRSNSTLLIEMHMKLIADAVNTSTFETSKGVGSDECISTPAFETLKGVEEDECGKVTSDNNGDEVDQPVLGSQVLDEEEQPCRLYMGIRINDRDENTKL